MLSGDSIGFPGHRVSARALRKNLEGDPPKGLSFWP